MTTSGAAELKAQLQLIPITSLHDHPANPRKNFVPEAMAELEASVRDKGVLVPLSVRKNVSGYEILGGARRFRAAQAAGLVVVPALVRDVDDATALELVVLDNLQRADLHPLEEAQGFHSLQRQPGYDVAKVAARVGRSVQYVYDRLKLLSLIPGAMDLFLANKFTAAHAILLARLSRKDQERAIVRKDNQHYERSMALFAPEHTLFDPETRKRIDGDGFKARSVREFQSWIDENVRFEPERDADPMLFPETAANLAEYGGDARKVIPITFNHVLRMDARSSDRTYSIVSWRRADGQKGSKTCEHARLGYVAAGPHRGDSFLVCVARDRCTVHWQKEARRKKARAAARATAPAGAKSKALDAARAKAESARQALDARVHNELFELIPAAVLTAATRGTLADAVRGYLRAENYSLRDYLRHDGLRIGTGTGPLLKWISAASEEQLARALAYSAIERDENAARAWGVDVAAIEKKVRDDIAAEQAAKAQTSGTASPAKTKKGGKAA